VFYILFGHSFINDIQAVSQIFYPNETFEPVDEPVAAGVTVVSVLEEHRCRGMVYRDGSFLAAAHWAPEETDEKTLRRELANALYDALREATGQHPAWGALSGVRPTKIVHELWRAGVSDEEALAHLQRHRRVTPEKATLCLDVARAEKEILSRNDGRDMALYIGIPFCPSRCLYCSFTAYPVKQYAGKLDGYLDALEREMAATWRFAANRRVESVYVGGGTPTALDDGRLERLFALLRKYFPPEDAREFTVEAGRPDTLTPQNLFIMKKYGVTRLSINPQTLCDDTLAKIGRNHTVEMFLWAFEWARSEGHGNINVDLIAGLPEETPRHMAETMAGVLALGPESVTVHTLAVKRASALKETLRDHRLPTPAALEEMLKIARRGTARAGMHPYYLYRQKNMLGNFENTGYCRPGRECFYNVQMMEERQSILALGAGAVTKAVDLERNLVRRAYNVKNVDAYITRLDEMIARKSKVLWP
jgi:oxygen-independent coproporphyrinogen-3 oxidase